MTTDRDCAFTVRLEGANVWSCPLHGLVEEGHGDAALKAEWKAGRLVVKTTEPQSVPLEEKR